MAHRGAPDARTVAAVFDLGRVSEPLLAVAGGWSHRLWRLSTDRGRFALKELNRDFDDPEYLDRYESACRVELKMIEGGVDAPRPILHPRDGRACVELPSGAPRPTTVRVHDWVDGEPLRSSPLPPLVAARVGALLARIHALELPTDASVGDVLSIRGDDYWRRLCDRARAAGLEWCARLGDRLPLVRDLESQVRTAYSEPARLIVTHRDLSPANVVLTPNGVPTAIDWDACGPLVPAYELAAAVARWSAAPAGEPDERAGRALLGGYSDAGGSIPEPTPRLLVGYIAGLLGWLDVCVRRALGERTHSREHQRQAEDEAIRVLDAITAYPASVERWTHWFS